jgi:hypothetical protein
MNVIGHDNRRVQIDSALILVQTAVQRDLPSTLRKNPSTVCAERQKMWFVIALQVRKIAPVKRLRHAQHA